MPAVDFMNDKIVGQFIAEILHVVKQQVFKDIRPVYMQLLFAFKQAESGKQSEKAKDVITMDMADKNMIDPA